MKRKVLVMVSLLMVLGLGFAGVADAEELEGSGGLWAKGAGYAEIHGNGAVDIRVHGTGTVWVKGAEVLHAEGRGRRWDLPCGGTVFAGWRGHLWLTSEDLAVKMWGGVFEFTAHGTGSAFLKGRGHYRVHGQTGRWTPEGVRVEWPVGGTPD